MRRDARLRANAWRHLSPPHLQSADGAAADHPLPSAGARLLERRQTEQPHRTKQASQRDDRLCYGFAVVVVRCGRWRVWQEPLNDYGCA